MTTDQLKSLIFSAGADLCGIAPADRFSQAPEGFRPTDIHSACKSVVVFAKRLPFGAASAKSCVPYTIANTIITQEVDLLTLDMCRRLEDAGLVAIPIPSDDPYEHWEAEQSYGRAILSLRHAAYLAGLGSLGKNTLLINNTYGNMIQLGAVLVDVELAGDAIADYDGCLEDCRLCLDACPANALDGETVNQQLCRPLSIFKNEKGYYLKKCFQCRMICPNATGIEQHHKLT
jgi:epoxyqueuosine reductase